MEHNIKRIILNKTNLVYDVIHLIAQYTKLTLREYSSYRLMFGYHIGNYNSWTKFKQSKDEKLSYIRWIYHSKDNRLILQYNKDVLIYSHYNIVISNIKCNEEEEIKYWLIKRNLIVD